MSNYLCNFSSSYFQIQQLKARIAQKKVYSQCILQMEFSSSSKASSSGQIQLLLESFTYCLKCASSSVTKLFIIISSSIIKINESLI